jgi:Glycine zipper
MTEIITRKVVANDEDLNRDPITGTPGAHPLGTGAGAASGGVAGAAVGTLVGGPIGAVIGAAVGAVAGGLAGKDAAESVNPTAEEIFWRETYLREPYYVKGKPYEYYAPAFRAGWEGRVRHDNRSFEQAEPELKADYMLGKSELDPEWLDVRTAARAAWDRVDRSWHAAR